MGSKATGIKKAVTKMKREAKTLDKQMREDPENISLALRCCLNPFCTTVKSEFIGNSVIKKYIKR